MAITSAQDIVQPRNTEIPQSAIDALTDSFRKGQITVSDIMARKQERDRAKVELQTLQQAQTEMMDPNAIAARQSQTQLAGATAQANLGLVQPKAAVEQTALEMQAAEQKYGPGIKLWQTLAPEAGIVDMPTLSNGQKDYAKMAEVGLQLAAQKVRKQRAVDRLQNPTIKDAESNGTKVLIKINQFGEHLTPELEAELRKQALEPLTLSEMKPGTAQVQPVTTTGTQPAVATAETSAIVPTGQNIPGVGMAVGAIRETSDKPRSPEALAQELVSMDEFSNDINKVRQSIKGTMNVVGPGRGTVIAQAFSQGAAALGSGDEQLRRDAQRDLEIFRSVKVLEGAQKMKGNLSDKDIRFLQDTIPKLTDSEALWSDYLDKMGRMTEANKKILRGELPKGYSVLDEISSGQPSQGGGQIIDVISMEDLQRLPRGARPKFPDGSVGEPKK